MATNYSSTSGAESLRTEIAMGLTFAHAACACDDDAVLDRNRGQAQRAHLFATSNISVAMLSPEEREGIQAALDHLVATIAVIPTRRF